MSTTVGLILGAIAGASLTLISRRYLGSLLWWLFTTDTR